MGRPARGFNTSSNECQKGYIKQLQQVGKALHSVGGYLKPPAGQIVDIPLHWNWWTLKLMPSNEALQAREIEAALPSAVLLKQEQIPGVVQEQRKFLKI